MSDEEIAVRRMIARDEAERFKRFLIVFVTITICILAGSLRASQKDVRMTIFPKMQLSNFGTAAVNLDIYIDRNEKNRGYEVKWSCVGEEGYRDRWERQLDGEEASVWQGPTRRIAHLTPCEYVATLTLYRNDGTRRTFHEKASVH